MKATIKLIKKSRKFSEAYKKSIVADFESGKFSVSQLERLHKISNRSIYRWIYKYSPSSSGVILHIFKSSN
ncbi:transposase [Galbibacter orientalis DSM 19592]|uniref:Transposase n=1 Tax=Galbibacter orientalis DSM 19592 TaxID=926559 RepID=I3C184_9FLAO|nr:transposase [Galbibacter orientalis DSM 19592]